LSWENILSYSKAGSQPVMGAGAQDPPHPEDLLGCR
jgi:hypothetical protein